MNFTQLISRNPATKRLNFYYVLSGGVTYCYEFKPVWLGFILLIYCRWIRLIFPLQNGWEE